MALRTKSQLYSHWKGDIVCVAGASGYSANPFRVRWQWETRENPEQRNEFCWSTITRKIEATIVTLEKSIPRSDKWGAGNEIGLCRIVSARRKSTRKHFRIARIGGQLRRLLFLQLGRHSD